MFSSYATPAKHWRARAKEALAIADQMSDPDAEEVMWRLALRYQSKPTAPSIGTPDCACYLLARVCYLADPSSAAERRLGF
jgi:hypothetical protein